VNEPVVSLKVTLETGTVKPPASATGTRSIAMTMTAMIANGRILFDLGFEGDGGDVISCTGTAPSPNGIIDLSRELTYYCL